MPIQNSLRLLSLVLVLASAPLSGCTFMSNRTGESPPTAWVGADRPCFTEAEFIEKAGPVRDRWVVLDESQAYINRHDVRTAGSRQGSEIGFAFRAFPYTILLLPFAIVTDIARIPEYIVEALTASRFTQIYVLVEPIEGQYRVTAHSSNTYELSNAPTESVADLSKLTWYDARTFKRVCIPSQLRRVPAESDPASLP